MRVPLLALPDALPRITGTLTAVRLTCGTLQRFTPADFALPLCPLPELTRLACPLPLSDSLDTLLLLVRALLCSK